LSPVQIHAGDVDGDGRIDLISVENDPNIFDADRTGGSRSPSATATGPSGCPAVPPRSADADRSVIGTWNSDGLTDLAVASGTTVTSFLGSATSASCLRTGPTLWERR